MLVGWARTKRSRSWWNTDAHRAKCEAASDVALKRYRIELAKLSLANAFWSTNCLREEFSGKFLSFFLSRRYRTRTSGAEDDRTGLERARKILIERLREEERIWDRQKNRVKLKNWQSDREKVTESRIGRAYEICSNWRQTVHRYCVGTHWHWQVRHTLIRTNKMLIIINHSKSLSLTLSKLIFRNLSTHYLRYSREETGSFNNCQHRLSSKLPAILPASIAGVAGADRTRCVEKHPQFEFLCVIIGIYRTRIARWLCETFDLRGIKFSKINFNCSR